MDFVIKNVRKTAKGSVLQKILLPLPAFGGGGSIAIQK